MRCAASPARKTRPTRYFDRQRGAALIRRAQRFVDLHLHQRLQPAQLGIVERARPIDRGFDAAVEQRRGDAKGQAELPLDGRARISVAAVDRRLAVDTKLDRRDALRAALQAPTDVGGCFGRTQDAHD